MRRILVLALLLGVLSLTGCMTLYGNEKQYDEGRWHWYGTSGEIAQIKKWRTEEQSRQLAQEKMKKLPAKGDPVNGFEGTAGNTTDMLLNYVFIGPEKLGEAIPPRTTRTLRLIPGTYDYVIKDLNGVIYGRGSFHVTAQLHRNQAGDYVHFYVYR